MGGICLFRLADDVQTKHAPVYLLTEPLEEAFQNSTNIPQYKTASMFFSNMVIWVGMGAVLLYLSCEGKGLRTLAREDLDFSFGPNPPVSLSAEPYKICISLYSFSVFLPMFQWPAAVDQWAQTSEEGKKEGVNAKLEKKSENEKCYCLFGQQQNYWTAWLYHRCVIWVLRVALVGFMLILASITCERAIRSHSIKHKCAKLSFHSSIGTDHLF